MGAGATARIKELAHVAARSRALLLDRGLQFATASRWPGLRLPLHPTSRWQLWFAVLEDPALAPSSA